MSVEKARTRVLEMLSDPGMCGGDGIGEPEVDALIAAVRAEFKCATCLHWGGVNGDDGRGDCHTGQFGGRSWPTDACTNHASSQP